MHIFTNHFFKIFNKTIMPTQPKLTRFNQNVLSKYQIYNSIFMTLPFDTITKTGALLPLFHETCQKGFEKEQDPTTIVETFFKKYQIDALKRARLIYCSGLYNT